MRSAAAVLFLSVIPLTAGAAPADPLGSNYIADVAERVTPAVVNITTERTRRGGQMEGNPLFREFFSQQPRPQKGAGSGVVISADGYIVTNNHVVEDADHITVAFTDRREYRAKLIGADKPSDLALLKIDATGLPSLAFGDSTKLRLGEYVLAVGNPYGVGQTVTMGIVSAKGRSKIGIIDYEDFIQTDAAINPGNSGGALVNMRGELVGINTAILSRTGGAQGIGFAVPTSMVKPILDQIQKEGRVRRGWLGVGIQNVTPDLASTMELDTTDGVLVSHVMEDGPADKGGLKEGDLIVTVNGRPTITDSELKNMIAMLGPNAKVKLEVIREGKRKTIELNLAEKPDSDAVLPIPEADRGSLLSGLMLHNLSGEARRRLQLPRGLEGVLVVSIEPGSPASDADLSEGDVITHVDRTRIRSTADLKKLELDKKTKVLLRVWTAQGTRFVVLRR